MPQMTPYPGQAWPGLHCHPTLARLGLGCVVSKVPSRLHLLGLWAEQYFLHLDDASLLSLVYVS